MDEKAHKHKQIYRYSILGPVLLRAAYSIFLILRDKQRSPRLSLPHSALQVKGKPVGVGGGQERERMDSHRHKVHDLWPLTSKGQGIVYPMVGWNLQEMGGKNKNQIGFLNH